MIELNCILTWFIGIEKLLLNVRKLASAPTVNPTATLSERAIAPPIMAQIT